MSLRLIQQGKCPLCESDSGYRRLYELGRFNLYECRCGMKFIDPSLDSQSMIEFYNSPDLMKEMAPELVEYYDYDAANPASRTFRDYSESLKRIARHTSGKSLIEIGCGRGAFLKVAKDQGWDVTGLDGSPKNIEAIQAQGIPGICCDFLEFEGREQFDAVALWDLIEHPQEPNLIMRKCRQILKPGGILFLATPHDPSLLSILAGLFYRVSGGRIQAPVKRFYHLEHTTYFSKKTLSQLFERNGFAVLESWKAETDLARYRLPWATRCFVKVSFRIARLVGLENRILIMGRKRP